MGLFKSDGDKDAIISSRKKMFIDLLNAGSIPTDDFFGELIRFANPEFLEIFSRHPSGRRFLNTEILKARVADTTNQFIFNANPGMKTALMVVYNRFRMEEALSNKESDDQIENAVSISREEISRKVTEIITSP
jgi:hypothetical protein